MRWRRRLVIVPLWLRAHDAMFAVRMGFIVGVLIGIALLTWLAR
jgi:hypothetical protein